MSCIRIVCSGGSPKPGQVAVHHIELQKTVGSVDAEGFQSRPFNDPVMFLDPSTPINEVQLFATDIGFLKKVRRYTLM